MRPLQAGDDHNFLSNRSKGDPHPQYTLRTQNGTPGGSLSAGTVDGELLYWDQSTNKWIPTGSSVTYDDGIATFNMPSAYIAATSECTGNWLIHGASGIKLEITEVGPGVRRFAIDTAEDRVEILAGQLIKRTAVSATPHAVAKSDYYLAVDTTAAITINLPAANAALARVLIIKDAKGTGATTNAITITPAGADTTEVGSIAVSRGSVTLISDGTSNWESV